MKQKVKAASKRRTPPSAIQTAFWDTSAIVPLCCYQRQTTKARQAARIYARQMVWWGTPIEALSAINRLVREGYLKVSESKEAITRLDYLRRHWNEVQPIEEVRELAERLLGRYRLRAADALQLAAALVWCENRPRQRVF